VSSSRILGAILIFFGGTAQGNMGTFSPEEYFTGVGQAIGSNELDATTKATDMARAELAKSVAAKVEASSESSINAAREKNGSGPMQEYVQKTYKSTYKITAAIGRLTDIEIRRHQYSATNHRAEVLLVIDRAKYVKKHLPDLKERGRAIHRIALEAASATKALRRVALFKRTLSLYDQARSEIETYRAVRRASDPSILEIVGTNREQLIESLLKAASSVRFVVQLKGSQELLDVVTSTLTKFGFVIGDNGTTTLNLTEEVKSIPDSLMASHGMHLVRASLTVMAEEYGHRATSFELVETESSQDEGGAKIRAFNALKTTIDESLISRLLEAL